MAKDKGGRPTDYQPEFARQALFVIEDSGFSMAKLCKLFNVARSTIYRWMEFNTEFSDAIRQGRKAFEGLKIHRALVKRATGYRYTETVKEWDPVLKDYRVVKKTAKQVAPDVNAIKHWQVNMDPKNWTDQKDSLIPPDAEITVKFVSANNSAKDTDEGD